LPEQTGRWSLPHRNLTFKTENRKYDYCKAKFSTEIGEMLKPQTGSETGQLRKPQPVELLLDNERIAALYFKPDSVRYTNGGTHIEFYDLQESMDSGLLTSSGTKLNSATSTNTSLTNATMT
jgi:hypothetical protein